MIRIGPNMTHALKFAQQGYGWTSYAKDRATTDAINSLERLGLVITNEYRQFRLS